MALTKEKFANLKDKSKKEVHVKGWGDSVFIKTLTVKQHNEILKLSGGDEAIKDPETVTRFRTMMLAFTMCEENLNLIFENEEEAEKILGEMSPKDIDEVFTASLEFNGMDAKATERIEKNSEGELSIVS